MPVLHFELVARNLTDIDPEDYSSLVTIYGEPLELRFKAEFQDFECELVRRSANKGRNHDITCFIAEGEDFVVIQKHQYANSGIYRAPSGGANFGESLEAAAKREMLEETGLEIELERFVLDMRLDVVCSDGVIPWRSLVFLAKPIGGSMKPIDTYEIFDVKLMKREDLLSSVQLMIESGWGGFKYRAFLTESFFRQADNLGLL